MPKCPSCGHVFQEKTKKEDYTEDFLAFWKAYAAKSPAASKTDAFKAWKQVLKDLPPMEELLKAVKAYHEHLIQTNGISCHPSTWLRQKRYEGFLEKPTEIVSSEANGQSFEIDGSWAGHKDFFTSFLGKEKFHYWFKNTSLSGTTITVDTPLKRDFFESRFATMLYRALGNFQIVVGR